MEVLLTEMTFFTIVYNLERAVMAEAAGRQGVDLKRLSFIDALRWLTEAEPEGGVATIVVNPDRPNRAEPRVRKRRPKEYPLMKSRARFGAELEAKGSAA